MDTFYYFQVMRKITIQMLDLFNNIKVAKYDANGNVTGNLITVPIKFAPKEKFYYYIYQQDINMLPSMSMYMTGINYNGQRKQQRTYKITVPDDEDVGGSNVLHYTSTPNDMIYELVLASKYTNEAFQVIEQIIPFFDPYVMLTVSVPEIGNEYDFKVTLDSVILDTMTDIPVEDYYLNKYIFTMTVQAEFLRPRITGNRIKEIFLQFKNFDYYEDTYATAAASGGENLYETMYISGGEDAEGHAKVDSDGEILYQYEILDDYEEYKDGDITN